MKNKMFLVCIALMFLLVACATDSSTALDQSGENAATLYQFPYFQGRSEIFGVGDHRIDESQFGFRGVRFSSLKVSDGYQVQTCRTENESQDYTDCKAYLAGDYPIVNRDVPFNILIVSENKPTPDPLPQNPSLPQTGTVLRQDGTMLLNGSPFFTFGFYTNARATLEQQMQAVQMFNEAGLNTLFFDPLGASADDYEILFDEAAKQNVMLIPRFWSALGGAQDAEGNWFPTPDVPFVHRFKAKPALLAWALVDDVQRYNDNRGAITDYNNNVKNADPNHVTYLTGDPGDDKAISYLASTDLMAIQSYPIPNCCVWTPAVPEGAPHLSKTYWDIANSVAKAEAAGKPVIANLQAFSWDYPGHPETVTDGRWPTPQELDNMTYQAVVAGAKGILYYTFENFNPEKLAPPETMLPETHPELWGRVPVLAEELKRLTPALLNGKRVSFISDDRAIYGATWDFEGRMFLAVVNTSEDAKDLSISLEVTPGAYLLPFSENRATNLTLSESQLTGFMEARDVQLYEVENP